MVKRMAVVLAVIVSLVCFGNMAAQAQDAGVVIKMATGDVTVMMTGKPKTAAKAGSILNEKQILETGKKSYAQLVMADGSEIKINENTKFSIEAMGSVDEACKAALYKGQLWSKIVKGHKIVFKTPSCLAAVRGTEFDIKVGEKGKTEVLLYQGKIIVENKAGKVELSQPVRSEKCKKTVVIMKQAPKPAVTVSVKAVAQWQKKIAPAVKKEEKKADKPKKEEEKKDEPEDEEIEDEDVAPMPSDEPAEEASPSTP